MITYIESTSFTGQEMLPCSCPTRTRYYSGAHTFPGYEMKPWTTCLALTIYVPMIYTAPCTMFRMRAYPLQGQVGGGWALEFESFLGPVKWHRADRRVPFHSHPKHYAQGCINHRCIGGFMHKSPLGRFQDPY